MQAWKLGNEASSASPPRAPPFPGPAQLFVQPKAAGAIKARLNCTCVIKMAPLKTITAAKTGMHDQEVEGLVDLDHPNQLHLV